MFESSVILQGNQAPSGDVDEDSRFESSVILQGNQAIWLSYAVIDSV